MFSHMLAVVALLHILDGLEQDLHESLPGFSKCMSHSVALMGLLCHERPRLAFVRRVVRGGGFDHYSRHFKCTFPLFTEHRWASLQQTIHWVLPLCPFLIDVWNPRLFRCLKFKTGDLNVDAVSRAIRSRWFWSYQFMVQEVTNVVTRLASWAEDCPRHS